MKRDPKKHLQQAIDFAGGLTKFADKIGATKQQVWNWRERQVPAHWATVIEEKTGFNKRLLRPDVFK